MSSNGDRDPATGPEATAPDGYRLGVDIGGTFTDVVLLGSDGTMHTRKVLSTPNDYARASSTAHSASSRLPASLPAR